MKIDSNSPVSSPIENKPLLQDVESVPKDKFEDVLASETQAEKSLAEESFKKAPDVPDSTMSATPTSTTTKLEATVHYGLGEGPGYGSCVGTAGYGGDSCPEELLNTISRSDAGAEELKLCHGSGYATGVTFPGGLGTPGYGGDSCPDELQNVIRSTDDADAAKFQLAKGSGYGSCVGTAGYGSDTCPDEPSTTVNATGGGVAPKSDH